MLAAPFLYLGPGVEQQTIDDRLTDRLGATAFAADQNGEESDRGYAPRASSTLGTVSFGLTL